MHTQIYPPTHINTESLMMGNSQEQFSHGKVMTETGNHLLFTSVLWWRAKRMVSFRPPLCDKRFSWKSRKTGFRRPFESLLWFIETIALSLKPLVTLTLALGLVKWQHWEIMRVRRELFSRWSEQKWKGPDRLDPSHISSFCSHHHQSLSFSLSEHYKKHELHDALRAAGIT